MDLDLPLLILATAFALIVTARSLRARPRQYDWGSVGALTLVVIAAGMVLFPDHVGLVSFGLYFVLGLAPILLARAAMGAGMRLDMRRASAFVRLAYWLHPTRPMRLQAERLAVVVLEQRGDTRGAVAAIDRMLERAGPVAPKAETLWERMTRLRLEERWDELDMLVESLTDEDIRRQPMLLGAIRFDLDLGRRSRAFDRASRFSSALSNDAMAGLRHITALSLFAISGQRERVQAILASHLSGFAPIMRELWDALAAAAAGDPAGARRLEALAHAGDPTVARLARARLLHIGRLDEDPLTDRQRQTLDSIASALAIEGRYRFGSETRSSPVATFAVAGLIGFVFLLEVVLGGAMNLEVLDRLGALNAPAVVERHEVHRLVMFLFLHAGAAHLIFNGLGLLVLGPFVERALGRARFLVTYFTSGLVGGVLLVVRDTWILESDEPLVGASGCIMGVFGARIAIFLLGYRSDKSPMARRSLIIMLVIVVLQTGSDMLIANVSLFAHAVGAITGFLVALLIAPRAPRALPAALSVKPARGSLGAS